MGDAVAVVDMNLRVVHWNSAMERLTGLDRAAALHRGIHRLVPDLDRINLPHQLRRALSGAVGFTAEVSSGVRVDVRCTPLTDAAGQPAGAAAFLADMTERQRRALFMGALEAIGRSLTSSLDLDEVLKTIVQHALEVMTAESALVVSWDGQSTLLRVMRAAGRLSDRYGAADAAIPVGGGPISRAVLEARPMSTANILNDPRFWLTPERRDEIAREGFKAVAAAPLVSKGAVHGGLVVHAWTERHFSEDELRALALLAEHAAIAIDNARLYADATRRAERLRELAEVERLVAGSLELDDVLQRIAEATARLVGAPVAHLWTTDPGSQLLRLRAAALDPSLPAVPMPATLAFGDGISGTAAQQRRAIFVPDATQDARVKTRDWALEAGLSTVAAVPILSGETLLGVLTVRARSGSLSADEDQALIVSLAGRAALAMQNARAYAEAVRRGARLQELAAVSQSITASLDRADIMPRIVAAAAAMRPGALAAVHAYDAEQEALRFAGSSPAMTTLPDERPARAGLPGLVFEQRAPVLIAEPMTHPRTLAKDWWAERPRASYYGVPILVGETFVGVLDFVAPDGVPDAEEQEALRLLAAQAGIAIRNAWLYQAERTQADRLGALAAINQRISSALDLDDLLRMIAESAASLTGIRFALFWLADDDRRTLTIRAGSEPNLAETLPQPTVDYQLGAVGWVARERTALVIDDVFHDPRTLTYDWWRQRGVRSFAGYPVLAGDRLLAVLVLCQAEPIRFTEETREVVDMFIAQASVAIQNVRLYRDAQGRRVVAERLARVSRELAGTLDIERIAELVSVGVVELLDGLGSAVYRYDAATGSLHAIASHGQGATVNGMTLGPGEGVAGRAVADGRITMTTDILAADDITLTTPLRQRITTETYRSVVAVPLVARERVMGALAMGGEPGRLFTADDLQVLSAFADQAALAFENAGLYASARDSLARLRETQAQLVQAGKMSALGQLVSGVAHELNNPLSVIIGYGQLLLNRNVPDAMRRPVELMVSQGDRMAKIVRNLLYFARQRPAERVAVDLHQVIEQTLALRLNQLTLSGIEVEKDFAETLPPVAGDAPQLQQVFLNLVLNAEQAIGEGRSGRIVFRTRVVDDPARADTGGRCVRAEVIDNGPGIPPDVLPRVFEPFFTTKEVGAGTGLGLSVSYGIIEEHGGRLTAESEPGRTVFGLELPVGVPVAVVGSSPVAHDPFAAEGRTALLVEDEPGVVDLVTMLLRDTGWRVDVATGGRVGLEFVRSSRYDLVISDVRMPDGGGAEFYRNALVVDPTLDGRFVFITGDTANVPAWEFLRATGQPVLEKPFAPDTFLDVVRRVATALTGSGSRA
jgi:PAS domain S-box-containing protein